MKWLNYHHLIYFAEIANSGSISKASLKLLIGQPTLSSQLKQFEEELQVELFERKNKHLVLTEAGSVVLKYANEVAKLGQELLHIIQEKSFINKAALRLGALDSVPKEIVWSITKKAQSFGECFISITEGTHEELTNELLLCKIDCFISNYEGDINRDQNICSKSFSKTPVSIYGSKKFLQYKDQFPKSLNGISMILPIKQTKLRNDLDFYFNKNQIKISSELETQDSSLIKVLAAEGAGLAALPDLAVLDLVRENNLYKIGNLSDIEEEYWVISAKRTIEHPLTTKLIQSI